MKNLIGKVAIVTGASSGIGRATAKLFAEEGVSVVLGARRQDALFALVEEIKANGGEAYAIAGDIRHAEYSEKLVRAALDQYDGLDIAFNNAGTLGAMTATTDMSLSEWCMTIETNLTSAFLAAKAQIPAMRDSGGSIIFTSSFVGHGVGMPQMADYSASKSGLIGLTKSLAVEYGSQGIRVNALLPGGTDTPMAAQFGESEEVKAFVRNMHALKRTAIPEEIAQSALYLASDASCFTTGTAMLVDGGVSICKT